MTDQEAIKQLVPEVNVEAATSNSNAFNEAVEEGLKKILNYYQLRIVPTGFQWLADGSVSCSFTLAPEVSNGE